MTEIHGSRQAETLAQRFEAAVAEAADVFESLTTDQCGLDCPGEGRTVAALARHIATAIAFELRAMRAIAAGATFEPIRWDWLHDINAEMGAANAAADVGETLVLLRRNATVAAREVRALTDVQLARRGVYVEGLPDWTVAELIEQILVGHITGHLASIRAALTD